MAENTLYSRKLSSRHVLPLAITPNVAPMQAYVSNDTVPHVTNKLEFELTGDVLSAFKEHIFSAQKMRPLFNDIKDWDRVVISVPIFNEPREKEVTMAIYSGKYFQKLNKLYGNLIWGVMKDLNTDALLDATTNGFLKLPQFELVLHGMKSDPCVLCPNYKAGQVCLYKTKGYQCLFTSGLEVKSDDPEMLSNILSLENWEVPDDSYEEWERKWFGINPEVPELDMSEEE